MSAALWLRRLAAALLAAAAWLERARAAPLEAWPGGGTPDEALAEVRERMRGRYY